MVASARTQAGAADQRVFVPLVQQPGIALETIAIVDMPFDVYNAVQPDAVQAVSGYWYIVVYRTGAGDQSGSWLVRWREGQTVNSVGKSAPSNASADPIPGGPYTNARSTIACGRDHMLYQFAWQGDGSSPKLIIGRLNGDSC